MSQTCFGADWALPLAAMLLALRSRKYADEAIVDGFCSMFDDEEVKKLHLEDMKFEPESRRLPELRLYWQMMKAIRQRIDDGAVADLGKAFGRKVGFAD
ncbi:hypothetical protein JX265_005827 [Neoarthrinium moseri]|uniref:Uncharacterized protein n=1 Tax=Neoarthrinium moseri TaxID=1658444 RepID=A0A9P9WN17_9PEZI|nr:uncharacterized protein JN550_011638 [Neoarthrinium moseri]KAI1860260.1 hypothetical protein JN550_011638 [Neoarthrinium moseri]KAI1871841.1 hypothetical protein JX265_005827 [Neoarthrinium moseri]